MLSTSKTPAPKLLLLDAIRGLAALYVVLHHYFSFTALKQLTPPLLRVPFRFGQEAVIIFFLLSGFVIHLATQKAADQSFKTYFFKRFVRIYPIFLSTLILSLVVAVVNGSSLELIEVQNFLGNALMLQETGNKPGTIVSSFLDNHALWSLSYEWWFYMLLFPMSSLLVKAKRYYSGPAIYLVLLFSALSYTTYLLLPNHILLVFSYLLIWWAGIACAELYGKGTALTFASLAPLYSSLLCMTLLASTPLLILYREGHTDFTPTDFPFVVFRHFAFAFLCIGLAHAYSKLKPLFRLQALGLLARLAPISYALYCVHFPVLWLRLPFIHNIVVELLLKFMLTVALSYVLERKLQPLVNRVAAKLLTPAPAALTLAKA